MVYLYCLYVHKRRKNMNNEITDKSIYDVLKERDLIKQITYEDEFKEMV